MIMNYDETGHDGPDFQVVGPVDGDVEELLADHPDWTDEQIAEELGITVWAAADARSRA